MLLCFEEKRSPCCELKWEIKTQVKTQCSGLWYALAWILLVIDCSAMDQSVHRWGTCKFFFNHGILGALWSVCMISQTISIAWTDHSLGINLLFSISPARIFYLAAWWKCEFLQLEESIRMTNNPSCLLTKKVGQCNLLHNSHNFSKPFQTLSRA